MPDKDRGREPAISISISAGTPAGLEALLAEAAKGYRPAEWIGEGLAQYGIHDGDKVDPPLPGPYSWATGRPCRKAARRRGRPAAWPAT
jgi:hypothetical protein